MSWVRVGVDVGGTFTKAVAVDLDSGEIVGRAVVLITHADARGVAAGVVRTVAEVVRSVGAERVDLVTHSTTQAVNALLEGDVGTVGVLGLGRRSCPGPVKAHPAERRRSLPGPVPAHAPEFPRRVRTADGPRARRPWPASGRWRSRSSWPRRSRDDSTFECRVTAMANEAGLPACASAS